MPGAVTGYIAPAVTVTFQDIEAARERIKGAVYYTACLPSIPLRELTGMGAAVLEWARSE